MSVLHVRGSYLALFMEPLDANASRPVVPENDSATLLRAANRGGPDVTTITADIAWPHTSTASLRRRLPHSTQPQSARARLHTSPYSQPLRLSRR